MARSSAFLSLSWILLASACRSAPAGPSPEDVAVQRAEPQELDPATMDPPVVDRAFPARMDDMTIESDGSAMNAIVYVAQGRGPHPTVILLHGLPGNERNSDLAQAIRRGGWNVVYFHYRGAWGSEGRFSLEHVLEDVVAVTATVRSPEFARAHRIDPDRIVLVGHSMGGCAALVSGAEMPAVRGIASLAGANLGVVGRGASADPDAVSPQAGAGRIAPIPSTSLPELLAEAARHADRLDPRTHVAELAARPVLLVAGERDTLTPMREHHAPLVRALRDMGSPRLRTLVLDADHEFSDKRVALARAVVTWLNEECR